MVDEVLGEEFAGVLVSDFYAAYHHYDGPKQRCWAHLLRDVHDLRVLHPQDHQLAQWADAVHPPLSPGRGLHTSPQRNNAAAAQLALENRLLPSAVPSWTTLWPSRPSCADAWRTTSRELFVFVAHPEVPPDNNAAERSLRHLVVSRKISGGTRSNPRY